MSLNKVRVLVLTSILAISIFAILSRTALSPAAVSVNISITPSEAWWSEPVNATGVVIDSSSQPVASAQVNVTFTGGNCTANTNSIGRYSCNFTAPRSLGDYTIEAVTNDSAGLLATVSTTLTVALNYGPKPIGSTDRAVYEGPILVQEPSGKIVKAIIRLLVWRG